MSQLEDIYALRSDPNVMKYIGDGKPQTKEQVENFIVSGKGYFEKYGLDFFSVYEKNSDNFIGQAGLFHLGFNLKQSDIELAYRLNYKYWGLGYATELANALIKYGFETLNLPRIIAMHHPDNIASKRVIDKSGMEYCGIIDYKGFKLPGYEIYKLIKIVNDPDTTHFKNKFTSCIILSQDKKIILLNRGDDFYTYPGYLCAFGGKVEPYETPLETIVRELKEELDVDVPATELDFIAAYTEEISKHNDLVYGYFWHDQNNQVQTCYEGNISYFDTVDNVFKNKKLLDDVPFLLYKCKQKNLINNTG